MSDPVAAKAAARVRARAARKALLASERASASASICAHIIARAAFREADLVLTYVPVGSEVDVLVAAAHQAIAAVRDDMAELKFNTAIARLFELNNTSRRWSRKSGNSSPTC